MSARTRVEDTYEAQNNQRLDDLHSKIRTLRGITTDIHDDVERQNTLLDDASDRFSSFTNSLSDTSRRAAQAFGIREGYLKTWNVCISLVGGFILVWFLFKVYGFFWPAPVHAPSSSI